MRELHESQEVAGGRDTALAGSRKATALTRGVQQRPTRPITPMGKPPLMCSPWSAACRQVNPWRSHVASCRGGPRGRLAAASSCPRTPVRIRVPPSVRPKESTLAGTKRPSFLKSQKERQRQQRAQEKREARHGKRARIAQMREAGSVAPETETEPPASGETP